MVYTDYDYAFVYKDYKGENGPNWQRILKDQIKLVERMIIERIIIFDDTENMYLWSGNKKPVYPELIPYLHIASMRIDKNEFFKDKTAVNKHYTQSFQVSTRYIDEFNTSFVKDLFSDNIFWRRTATTKIFEMVCSYLQGKAYLDNGVARWSSNDSVIPRDCYEPLVYSNILPRIYFEKNKEARKSDTENIIKTYRKKQKGYKPSAEERAEMENAFGKGTPVIDIFTGKRVL